MREAAIFPVEKTVLDSELIYPIDPEGQGSWFVSEKNGITACIMNGAFHPNKKDGDYRHSRGLIPLHVFEFRDIDHFISSYPFQGLEAFTLIVATKATVFEIIWNESELKHHSHPAIPLIFQSTPLYPYPLSHKRLLWFDSWLNLNNEENIIDFHRTQDSSNKEESILMDREIVKTISITQRKFGIDSDLIQYHEVENLNFSKKFIIR